MSAHYNESIIKHSTALLQGLPSFHGTPRSTCSDRRFELVPAPEATRSRKVLGCTQWIRAIYNPMPQQAENSFGSVPSIQHKLEYIIDKFGGW